MANGNILLETHIQLHDQFSIVNFQPQKFLLIVLQTNFLKLQSGGMKLFLYGFHAMGGMKADWEADCFIELKQERILIVDTILSLSQTEKSNDSWRCYF